MADLTLRNVKGSPLTNQEVDDNFSNLNTDKWSQDNTKISNWDTAYSWGDHAAVGYLTTLDGDGSDLLNVRAETVEVVLKNVSGSTIPKGTPVHQTGTSGAATFEVVPANASNASAMPAHFIAGEELANGAEGRGILVGRISGIDTSAFAEGDTIYVAPGGGYTNTAPTGEGNLIQNLGTVTRSDATNGGGEVYGAGRTAATPNLNQGNIFIGNATNKAVTAALSTSVEALASYNNANWDTAYGWGNHASAGYITSASLTGYATETYVNTAVSNLVDSAPATLDTLNELAAALGDDPNFATTVTNSIATKLPLAGGTLTGALDFGSITGRAITITADGGLDGADASIYLGNAPSSYGFDISYIGTGTGNANAFSITSTNAGAPKELLRANQDGIVNLPQTGAKVAGNTIFHDAYHPNADKWTTARTNTVSLTGDVTGSGSASVDGTGNWTVSISTAVANDSHDHTRLLAVDDRDMKPNTSGIGSNVKGIKAFFSSLGGMTGAGNTDYQDVLVLDTYSDNSGGNANAITMDKSSAAIRIWNAGQTATSWGTGYRLFADNYHPNADKWTTARTNTVSLTGDVTGTGSASVDGTGNWTVSISTAVANDSHTHDGRYVNVTGDTMTGTLIQSYGGVVWSHSEGTNRPVSQKTWSEAGSIGTTGSNFTDVYGEADLSAIDNHETFDYTGAWSACETHGGRLPTLAELMDGVGSGSGQSYDSEYLWTCTPAGPHHVWVAKGNYASYPDKKIVDITDPAEVYRTRCFFDVSRANRQVSYDSNGDFTTSGTISSGAITSTGNSVFTGSDSSGNAFNVNRGSDSTSALRVLNTGEVLVSSNYFYVDASQGAYIQNALRVRGSISNDTANEDLKLDDNVRVTGNLDVDGIIDNTRNNDSVAAPSTSDHTAGTRIKFYDSSATAFYAMGIESSTLWFNSDGNYKFYVDAVAKVDFDESGVVNAVGGYKVGGTTVINSSRNLTNINNIYSGGLTITNSGMPTLTLYDSGNGGGGAAEAKIEFRNTAGTAIAIGYTDDTTSNSDLIISTNAGGTYGGYLGLAAGAIADAQADIILEPKGSVRIATGGLEIGTTTVIDSSRNLTNIGTLNGGTPWHSGNDGSGSGLDADLLDGQHGSYYAPISSLSSYTPLDHMRSTGTSNHTSTTTSALLTELLNDGAFNSYFSVHKTSWSYAGNGNLNDAGRLTELAGSSWAWWTDASTDGVQGNITGLCIAPNTGGSAGKVFIYNNQGSSYSPGWREVWTSTSDGSGSGLDADLLDGVQGASFLRSDTTDDLTSVVRVNTTSSQIQTYDGGKFNIFSGTGYAYDNYLWGATSSNYVVLEGVGSTGLHISNASSGSAILLADGSVRSPIFYDSNNTSYYCNPASTSRFNQTNNNYVNLKNNNAYALRFWNGSDSYKINMSTASDATNGGRAPGETTSDYNMYFTMTGGTNRGFVFRSSNSASSAVAGIDASGAGYFKKLSIGGFNPAVDYDFNGSGSTSSADYGDYVQAANGLATGVDFSGNESIEANWTALSGTTYTNNKFRVVSIRGNSQDAIVEAVNGSTYGNGDLTLIGNINNNGTSTALTGGVAIDGQNVNIISSSTQFTGAIREKTYTISGTSYSLTPSNGGIQSHALSGATTYTHNTSLFQAGESMTLLIGNVTGTNTVTWPTITWVNNGGVAPDGQDTGYITVVLWKTGSTLYGALAGEY